MDFEALECQARQGPEDLPMSDTLATYSGSEIDETIALWDRIFGEPNDSTFDPDMQIPPSILSDGQARHDNAHANATDIGSLTISQPYWDRAIGDSAFTEPNVLLESNVLRESNGPPEMDSMMRDALPAPRSTLLELRNPLEMDITMHDMTPVAESDKLMFQEFTYGLVPATDQSTIGFNESHPRNEVNCDTASLHQNTFYVPESALQDDQSQQVQKRGPDGVEISVAENSSLHITAHPTTLDVEPSIKPDNRRKNRKASSTKSKPLRKTKLDELLGGCYRVQTFGNITKPRTKYDRQNNLAVRNQGGQCLRCIYYRRKCSPFSPGHPCRQCQSLSRNHEIECIGADFESLNYFAWGAQDILHVLKPVTFYRGRWSVRGSLLACMENAFALCDKKPDESKLLQFQGLAAFIASDVGGPLAGCLDEFRKEFPFGALTVFTVSLLLLRDQQNLLAFLPADQTLLKSCRAYCSTLLFTLVDQLVRGKPLSQYAAELAYIVFIVAVKILQSAQTYMKAESDDINSSQLGAATNFMGKYLTESINLLRNRFMPLVSRLTETVEDLMHEWEQRISEDGKDEGFSKKVHGDDELCQLKIGDLAAMLPPSWIEVSDQSEHSIRDPTSLLLLITLRDISLDRVNPFEGFLKESTYVIGAFIRSIHMHVKLANTRRRVEDEISRLSRLLDEVSCPLNGHQQKGPGSQALHPFAESIMDAFGSPGKIISFDPISTSLDQSTVFRTTTTLLLFLFLLETFDIVTASELNETLALLWDTGMYAMAIEFFLEDPVGMRLLDIFEDQVNSEPERKQQTRNRVNNNSAKVHGNNEDAFTAKYLAKRTRISAKLVSILRDLIGASPETPERFTASGHKVGFDS